MHTRIFRFQFRLGHAFIQHETNNRGLGRIADNRLFSILFFDGCVACQTEHDEEIVLRLIEFSTGALRLMRDRPDLLNRHLILGQCSRLVGTDN